MASQTLYPEKYNELHIYNDKIELRGNEDMINTDNPDILNLYKGSLNSRFIYPFFKYIYI
jgi:hypothetical protein